MFSSTAHRTFLVAAALVASTTWLFVTIVVPASIDLTPVHTLVAMVASR